MVKYGLIFLIFLSGCSAYTPEVLDNNFNVIETRFKKTQDAFKEVSKNHEELKAKVEALLSAKCASK